MRSENFTESFLLRRINSGPGVKAALTIGTTARADQMGVLENFMLLSRLNSLLCLSYDKKIFVSSDAIENFARSEHPLYTPSPR